MYCEGAGARGGAAEAGSKSAANGQTVTASSWPRVTIRIIAKLFRKNTKKNWEQLQKISGDVRSSPYRFWPTFELGAAQITSGADRLGEPKNQISEL